jgi:ammonium transporter, Amt family
MRRYGFNGGSALGLSSPDAAAVAARAAVATTLAAGTAGIVAVFVAHVATGAYDLFDMCNGILAGLVSVTASAGCIQPWSAIVIGAVGALSC